MHNAAACRSNINTKKKPFCNANPSITMKLSQAQKTKIPFFGSSTVMTPRLPSTDTKLGKIIKKYKTLLAKFELSISSKLLARTMCGSTPHHVNSSPLNGAPSSPFT